MKTAKFLTSDIMKQGFLPKFLKIEYYTLQMNVMRFATAEEKTSKENVKLK